MKSYISFIKFRDMSQKSFTSRHKGLMKLQVKTLAEAILFNIRQNRLQSQSLVRRSQATVSFRKIIEGRRGPPGVNLRTCTSSSEAASGQTSSYRGTCLMWRMRVTRNHGKPVIPGHSPLPHPQAAHHSGISGEFPCNP